MRSDEFGEVDIDLLADYIGGALDGPGAAEVARLIHEDPRWRETYDLLRPGMAAVGAELTTMGAAPEQMPGDLVARLEASFASPIAAPTTIDPVLAEPSEPHLVPTPGRHLSSAPATGVDRPAWKRKRLRWAAPIAVAAGVLAFAGFSADYLIAQSGGSSDSAQSTAGGAENAAPMMGSDSAALGGLTAAPSDSQILSTGTDYGSAALARSAPADQASKESDRKSSSKAAEPRLAKPGFGLAGLERLEDRDALLACLEAISREQEQGPIAIETVDYARFEGAPALVVRFGANGTSLTWAVGPECGKPGAGANRL